MTIAIVNNIECKLKVKKVESPYFDSYEMVEITAPADEFLSAQVSWYQIWNVLAARQPGCEIIKKFSDACERTRFDIDGITTIRVW